MMRNEKIVNHAKEVMGKEEASTQRRKSAKEDA
jgi:phage FluMu protein Com